MNETIDKKTEGRDLSAGQVQSLTTQSYDNPTDMFKGFAEQMKTQAGKKSRQIKILWRKQIVARS